MTVRGFLDGLEGDCLIGWAHSDSAQNKSCDVIVVDGTGRQVAQGQASHERHDLSSLNLGRSNLAFKIPGVDFSRPGPLHVFADGTELPNSPIMIGPGHFDGHFSVLKGVVHGMVKERTVDAAAPLIWIVDQNHVVVAEIRAQMANRDEGESLASAEFEGDLDQLCFGCGEIRLTAFANGVKFAENTCLLELLGHLEYVSPRRCVGWLFSPSAPHRSFTLEVFRDGKTVGPARCNVVRTDVQAVHPAARTPGFAATFPPTDNDGGLSTISLRFPGSWREVLDGPYVVGDRLGAIVTARRVAGMALGGTVEIGAAERSVLQSAMIEFMAKQRQKDEYFAAKQRNDFVPSPASRFTVIIPVYRGIKITRTCIESVLASCNPATDRIMLINDRSPDSGMSAMLKSFTLERHVSLIQNATNRGFVQTVNVGLGHCRSGDIILLNADTRVFANGLEDMWLIAHASPDIGTVTAISNNATIFSYPHPSLRHDKLADIGWPELAEIARRENRGVAVDVPTGHGFCMLIRREVLDRVGVFDEAYGRGYGEENDFCAHAADLGYRNVAAPGVLVEHRESISFAAREKAALLSRNLARLTGSYPEYMPMVMAAEQQDVLRRGRWALDRARLRATRDAGRSYVLVIVHGLGGGSQKAIRDIESAIGYGGASPITLHCRNDGFIELSVEDPLVLATFSGGETDELLSVLDAIPLKLVVVHQLLGFPEAFLRRFGSWSANHRTIFYAHDFYPLCPRVTMMNAVGEFCDVAAPAVCERCVSVGGAHEQSRLNALHPAAHRALFAEVLRSFTHVVSPSMSAAGYFLRGLPEVAVTAVPHPDQGLRLPQAPREGSFDEITLFGAIGEHKGSGKLLEIAQRAKFTHPELRFRVIGYTNVDAALSEVGNVVVTGLYEPDELHELCAVARGRLALFLSLWPETYSYTLSEAVQFGFVPLVPDLGAPAERVRTTGYGHIFPFPIDATEVLALIEDIATGRVKLWSEGSGPASFQTSPDVVQAGRRLLLGEQEEPKPAPVPPAGRRQPRKRKAAANDAAVALVNENTG